MYIIYTIYMYIIYVNNTLPLALAVHKISQHFWPRLWNNRHSSDFRRVWLQNAYLALLDVYSSQRGQH